jgi:hypothetical protein
MIALLSTLPIAAAAVLAAAPAPPREIENVAAFARLYGVVRFFYPSDAAAELDWNRFAVHGVGRVRAARDAAELGTTLKDLFASLGPGLEIGKALAPASPAATTSESLVAWRYTGPGFAGGGPYQAKRTHRAAVGGADSFVTLMQNLPGAALRGKAIRLRAQARATAADPSGGGALWLRVDRPNKAMGFFDNMGDRPIRKPEWRPYAIEGTVADDAENVALGVMAMGAVTADFDGVELAVKGTTSDWTPVPIQDSGFEGAVTERQQGGWFRTGPGAATISRTNGHAPEGRQFVRFAPPPAGAVDAELFPETPPTPAAHADVALASGLTARVPLVLTETQARPDPARATQRDALRASLTAMTGQSDSPDLDQRLADVVVAWNVFRHFYPYWPEAGVDWNARLRPQLEAARAADNRAAQRDAVRSLVADARDGHGFVADAKEAKRADLPVTLAVIEDRLIVTSSAVPSEAPVGAVVTTIDGVPAADRLARAMSLASGTTQWRRFRATQSLNSGGKGATVLLGLDGAGGPRQVTLGYGTSPPAEKRPLPVSEMEPGLWYVDLTRAGMADVTSKLDALARARGVVFDVRGYPTDAGAGILPHLLDAPETDRWMHVAKIVGPFHEAAGWFDFGCDVKPAAPHLAGRVVFLTDGGAISYAESVMGYVADRHLGTIVGSPTAGTNGNVASFVTPTGFRVSFTGMRVTRHDGRSPHHLVGVQPDVALAPTLAGVRAGRDEVLERGMQLARAAAPASKPRGPR